MAKMPDMFLVYGKDKYGEGFRSEEQTQEQAEYVAERINRRGGNVVVKRFVWNGPAATWVDPDVPFRRRISESH